MGNGVENNVLSFLEKERDENKQDKEMTREAKRRDTCFPLCFLMFCSFARVWVVVGVCVCVHVCVCLRVFAGVCVGGCV